MHLRLPPHRPAFRALIALGLAAGVVIPVTLGSLPSAAASKTYDGPDVADYQHPHGNSINWKKVAKDGKDFAIVKATEGTTYTNPYFASDYAGSLAAGLVHGSYHFARPAHPIASTAKAQATFFADTVGTVTTADTLPPALDLEVTGGLSPKGLTLWAQDFLLDLRALTDRTPMLYVSPYFWEHDVGDPAAFVRFPLWMAEYGVKNPPVSDLWQFTSTAHVKGIKGDVDLSKFVGTNGFPWSTLSDGTVSTPWTPSAPAAPPSVHASPSGAGVKVSWKAPDAGTSAVTGYKVVSSPGGQVINTDATTLHAKFNGLSTSQAYTFTVTATNAVGTGVTSAASNAVTPRIPTRIKTTVASAVTYGDPLTVQATLVQKSDGTPLPGLQVLVYRRSSSTGPWKQVGRTVTDSDGEATVTLHPKQTGHLETVFPGGHGYERSDIFDNFDVRSAVTAKLSASQTGVGRKVKMSGSVTPAVKHQKVKLEVLAHGDWTVVDTSKTSAHGHYSFTINPTGAGVVDYRVAAAATSKRAAGHSPEVVLTVT